MKAVGIRELKARLSHYVREVRHGEVILVTDRGEVVAELRQPHDPGLYQPSPLRVHPGTANRLLDEERGDDP
jgi:antitoxin (DNA-binding transcriptional repressor) of toxin-antitoxin stability system